MLHYLRCFYHPEKIVWNNHSKILHLQREQKRCYNQQYYTLVLVSYLDHPDYFRFMDQLQGSPIITKESRDEGYRTINPILEVLKQGQKEKIIKNIELDELLQFLGGSILSYLRWIIDEKDGKMKKASFKNQLSLTWDAIKK